MVQAMKLYHVPRHSIVKVIGASVKTNSGVYDEIEFDHIDGMYSVCYVGPDRELAHLFCGTDVEIIKPAVTYAVTGIERNGRRFKITTNSLIHAMGINLHTGTVWEVDHKGKRKAIKRVLN